MKSDTHAIKNLSLIMEAYNRQLLRKTNLYSRIMGDLVRISEKELEMLADSPKDFTLVDVIRNNF